MKEIVGKSIAVGWVWELTPDIWGLGRWALAVVGGVIR